MKVTKNKKGLTLIELLVAISILTIMMVALSSVYLTSIKTFRQELAQTKMQTEAQTILDKILLDTKLAQSVEPSYNTFTTGSSTLILRVPATDSSQNFIYSGSTLIVDRIIYYKSGQTIHKVVYADPTSSRYVSNGIDSTLANDVSSLTFSYSPDINTPETITTSMTLIKAIGKNSRSVTTTGKAKLRNSL